MLEDFQDIHLFRAITAEEILLSLLVAFGCGFVISLVYRFTYKGVNYSPSFVRSMIFLAMITAVVMLVIGNNLARAFGLVGAMSIIRFRTAVKDPQDIVFIFFALAVGLSAGVGLYQVALLSTLAISIVIVITAKSNYAEIHKESFLLQLSYDEPNQDGSATYLAVLRTYCHSHKLINVRSVDNDQGLDLTFFVDLKNRNDREKLTQALIQTPHVRNVNLYYDTEQG